jgi:biotin carboxyl carrier protein
MEGIIMSQSLIALCELESNQDQKTQTLRILSPEVGQFVPAFGKQFQASGGTQLGTLQILGKQVPLILPTEGVHQGRILDCKMVNQAEHPYQRCGYRSLLYTALFRHGSEEGELTQEQNSENEALHQHAHLIESPIDGTVYYAPAPDQPCFVQLGQEIQPNTVVALIEVMKFFYEIKYEGTQPVTIVEQVHQSGSPIEAGQGLWWVK